MEKEERIGQKLNETTMPAKHSFSAQWQSNKVRQKQVKK